jgi:bilin biosynthesis protein
MDKRFNNLFQITEEQAIELLQTPLEQLEDQSDRYAAASHLVRFKSDRSIKALMEAIAICDDQLYNQITKRKAIETLGRFKAQEALDIICSCLDNDDCYTVENAVWAIGEIGTEDEVILNQITQILSKSNQNYRVIIQVLAKLGYQPAIEAIKSFTSYEDQSIASAALSAIIRLTEDDSYKERIVELLQSDSVNVRRACIQDLMDIKCFESIGAIASCPVSVVFRLRAIRFLGETAIDEGIKSFADIEPYLDQVIRDHPNDLQLVHEYDQPPSLEFLINELYHTDFGRCYLATKTILDNYADVAGEALVKTYEESAHNDYGAHYHVMKLFGWLKYQSAYELLIESLFNNSPQFQKSRGASAIALGNLGDKRAVDAIQKALITNIFDLKYACSMVLKHWDYPIDAEITVNESDFLLRQKM